MTDIDFDEIDRAVSSLNTNGQTATDDPAAVSEPPVDGVSPQPVQQTPAVEPVAPSVPITPIAPRPTTGQFMDVVHPSSDMRKPSLVTPERPAPSVDTTDTPVAPQPVPNPVVTESTTPSTEVEKPEAAPMTEKAPDEDEDADIAKISDDITKALNDKTEQLSSVPDSPFLSDAKVEKRPLGAFSNDTTDEKVQNDEKPADNTPAETSVDPQTDNTESTPDSTDSQPNEPAIEQPTAPASNEIGVEADAQPTQPVPPVSITQQYKEQPSTGDQQTGGIYDTDAYHKGLIHPVKKKSGWMWVVWIAILVVAGAGIGAAIYFWMLPLL